MAFISYCWWKKSGKPVDMPNIPVFAGCFLLQLVQDFVHQQYFNKTFGYIPTSHARNRWPTFCQKQNRPLKKVTLQKCWRLTKWRSNEKTTLSFLPNSNSFGGFSHSKGFFGPKCCWGTLLGTITHLLPFGTLESIIFLFHRGDMLVPWRVFFDLGLQTYQQPDDFSGSPSPTAPSWHLPLLLGGEKLRFGVQGEGLCPNWRIASNGLVGTAIYAHICMPRT